MSYLRLGQYDIWAKREGDYLALRFEWVSSSAVSTYELKVDIDTVKFTDNGVFQMLSLNTDKGTLKIVKNPIGITKFKLIKWKLPIFWGQGKERGGSSIISEIIELAAEAQ